MPQPKKSVNRPKKPVTAGKMMNKHGGESVIGRHVYMEAYLDGRIRELIGTVKKIVIVPEPGEEYARRLVIHFFNGEPWPISPRPWEVEMIGGEDPYHDIK